MAEVKSNKVKFSNFYNSVLSLRIAEELELDLNEPYRISIDATNLVLLQRKLKCRKKKEL